MPLKFVHLSDIHFGQETGSDVFVHDDVKNCLIADATNLAATDASPGFTGVIVTGDIAFAGKAKEYEEAGRWLDQLTNAIGCKREDVIVIPGNHDIDRTAMSPGCKLMLRQIVAGGDEDLNAFLTNDVDREVLFGRFSNYRVFADAYSCPFDGEGHFASDRTLAVTPGRFLRFIGLNSALACSDEDVPAGLLLGVRQRLLPRTSGEELVVLCHHPLGCLQDSDEAKRYIHSRARVFIYGHIHSPSLKIETTPNRGDLMTLSAGATVPPESEDGYGFSYNVICFDWDAETDGLKVTIVPRIWNDETTSFDVDTVNFKDAQLSTVLRCPNFQGDTGTSHAQVPAAAGGPLDESLSAAGFTGGDVMDSRSRFLRLRFFRDLTPPQRVSVFVELGILSEGWNEDITHNIEHQLLQTVLKCGRYVDLERAIETAEEKRRMPTKDD